MVPEIDVTALTQLVFSELNGHWLWGEDAPHYSAYSGWTFAQVMFFGAAYLAWIMSKAATRPTCWAKFQVYRKSVLESDIYKSLAGAFVDEAARLDHMKGLLADFKQPGVMSEWFNVPDEVEIAAADSDIVVMDDEEVWKVGHEKLVGVDFELVVKADPIAAKRFAAYAQRRLTFTASSRSASTVATAEALPAIGIEVDVEAEQPEESENEEEPVQAKGKGRGRAIAKPQPAPKRQRRV